MTRQAVLEAAESQLGKGNLPEYWTSALGKPSPAFKKAWCGIFVLRCLHEAGLALGTHWVFGMGFLTTPDRKHFLPKTTAPEPGDIGYKDQPYQHHFIVESVEGGRVHSIDGNSGSKSTVNRCTHGLGPGSGCVYYTIAPLLLAQGQPEAPRKWVQPADVQRAVNALILRHALDGAPKLLATDGIIGPKSVAAIQWAQRELGIPVTGNPDAETCLKLGLS